MASPRLRRLILATIPSSHFAAALLGILAASQVGSVFGQATAETPSTTIGNIEFMVADGLKLESVSNEELTHWPIVADWDNKRRLIIAESGGVAKPIEQHNKQLLHRIVRLIDEDGDGSFDKRIIAADKLAFPEGVLCIDNSILVSVPPQILKLTDEDGDGVCEKRDVWYDPGTITGCANDLHGPYLGRDGWIYWCKGAFAEQTHALTNGKTLNTKAAHIFRRRLSGGPVEVVMTGGMDNPVEMAMTRSGERFFTSTFLQHPGGGKRDGIAHAVYGGVYGKDHQVINGHIRTGELMPITTHLGPAAPSGLICLESNQLMAAVVGAREFNSGDTLVAAEFNLHKVSAHRLVSEGASFRTQDIDLVRSEKIDFHPTDIIEDLDGSLLIIDTGGWYNLCCPSSGVDQKVASGGIYRLTSTETRADKEAHIASRQRATGTTKFNYGDLTSSRSWMREQTLQSIFSQPQNVTLILARNLNVPSLGANCKQDIIWTLARTGTQESLQVIAEALENSSPEVRMTAAHALSVNLAKDHAKAVTTALAQEKDPRVQRALAEAAGRLGDAWAAENLLELASTAMKDRALEHSTIYALIELNAPEVLAVYLTSPSAAEQRVALMVLDQLNDTQYLKPNQVLEFLSTSDELLAKTAVDVLQRHSAWSQQLATEINTTWKLAIDNRALRSRLVSVLASWSSEKQVTEFIDSKLAIAKSLAPAEQDLLLGVLTASRSTKLNATTATSAAQWLEGATGEQQIKIAKWLGGANASELPAEKRKEMAAQLEAVASALATKDPVASLQVIAAIPTGTELQAGKLATLVIRAYLGQGEATDGRSTASTSLERLKFSKEHIEQLLEGLDQAEPLRLMSAVTCVSRQGNDELDRSLMKRLGEIPAAKSLSLDQLTSLYRSRSAELKSLVASTVATLGKAPADVEAKLDELLGQLQSGDVNRGFQIFRSAKAGCSACHRIGYVGGSIGPDLTRIGGTRSRRALLESIVFPSARLEQSYQPTQILTTDGQVHSGLIARETDDALELVTGLNRNVTIVKSDIERRQPSNVSIMPNGLDQQLTLEQLADLLTLLEAAR